MKIQILSVMCSILQIAGLVLIVLAKSLPNFTPVLIGIAGFAAIVKYFLPDAELGFYKVLRPIAAFAGFGIIVFACTM
jgi:hypothetical protein